MKKSERVVLGIDCGGTNLKMALLKETGEIIESKIEPVDFSKSPEIVAKKIAASIRNFMKKTKTKNIESIGMGIAGDIDPKSGTVRFSPNMRWSNVPIKKMLTHELKIQVLIENDANCAAWGAYCLDAKKGCDNLICLTLGTGLGGGIVLNRKLYRGSTGSAGEIGHMTIKYDGRACRCGNFGCAESLIGAWGLIQTAEEGLRRGQAPLLKKMLEDDRKLKLEPKTLSLAAQRGDPYCQQLWRNAGEQLGCVLSNCVNIFNPDRIILCGGVSKVGSLILEPALHTLGQRAFKTSAQKVKVSISQFDERLGVVGAALLSIE